MFVQLFFFNCFKNLQHIYKSCANILKLLSQHICCDSCAVSIDIYVVKNYIKNYIQKYILFYFENTNPKTEDYF